MSRRPTVVGLGVWVRSELQQEFGYLQADHRTIKPVCHLMQIGVMTTILAAYGDSNGRGSPKGFTPFSNLVGRSFPFRLAHPSKPPLSANATAQQPAHAGMTLKLEETSFAWPVCLYVQFTPFFTSGVSSVGESRGDLSVC
jgi:hypothetical protein